MSRPAQYEALLLTRRNFLDALEQEEGAGGDGVEGGGRVAVSLALIRVATSGSLSSATAEAAEGENGEGGVGGGLASVLSAFAEYASREVEHETTTRGGLDASSLCRWAERIATAGGNREGDASKVSSCSTVFGDGAVPREWVDNPDSVEVDVDGFFDDYPECVRPDYEEMVGSSSDNSGESCSSELAGEGGQRGRRGRGGDRETKKKKSRREKKRSSREESPVESENDGKPLAKLEGRQQNPLQDESPDFDRLPYGGHGSQGAPTERSQMPTNNRQQRNDPYNPYGRTSLPAHPQIAPSPGISSSPAQQRPQSSDSSLQSPWNPYSGSSSRQHNRDAARASNLPGWDDYERPRADAHSSWGNVPVAAGGQTGASGRGGAAQRGKKANPFQTAREYAKTNPDDDDNGEEDEYGGASLCGNGYGGGGGGSNGGTGRLARGPPEFIQRGIQSMQGGGQPHSRVSLSVPGDDCGGDRHQGRPPPPSRGGPQISQGLRKKYQPPRRIGGGGGGGQKPRPSSSGPNGDGDDGEDLPEELKGLDKELVDKIQNEILDSGDPVTFSDIAGLNDAKQTVREMVCWPMKRPDLFTGLRRVPNGLLLFGPPGTGKTLVGKAIAYESGATFFSISSSSLTSKWIGEGEKLVRTLFAVASYREPSVVFIDEIDSMLTQRSEGENEASRRIKTEFLVQLDGTGTSKGRVLCVGATNRPSELDEAARRRFVKRLYIPLPERPDREVLIRNLLRKNCHSLSDREIVKLSENTKGFSGADLRALCADAALGPIRQLGPQAMDVDPEDVPPIAYPHFRRALRGMRPSVADSDLGGYLEFDRMYGSTGAAAAAGADGASGAFDENSSSSSDDEKDA